MEKIIKNVKTTIYYVIPWGIFIWCSKMIFNDSIWLDEAFSLSMIQQSFIDIIKNTAIDVHPPLYYMLLKFTLELLKFCAGNNIIWTSKLISMIPIGILIIVSYKEVAKIFAKKTAFLFNIFILGMPQIMKYSIEIRMYSLGLLFVTLFYISYIKWEKENANKELYKMIIFALLSAYTHYFAGVSVACIYFLILVEAIIRKDYKKLKRIVVSILAIFICYLPWIIIAIKQILTVKESYWIADITRNTIKGFFKYPYMVNGNIILTYVIKMFIIISILLILLRRKETNSKFAIYGFFIPIMTIIIGIIASKIIRPVFIDRYMVCSLGCLWLAVAIMLSSIHKRKFTFYIITIVIIITTICTNYLIIKNEKFYKNEKANLSNYLENIKSENMIMIFDSNQLQRIISYYYPNNITYVYKQEITQLTKQVYKQTNMHTLEDMYELDNEQKDMYIFAINKNILDNITKNNYKYEKCGDYQIEMYKFSIYKIIPFDEQ